MFDLPELQPVLFQVVLRLGLVVIFACMVMSAISGLLWQWGYR